ncbi:helix-turn-helix domain-containing protein [Nonomuraea sp. NPDC059007]|uniref:helix-turn-helix domain-containing protein n=1 Tax=Nonomuraea sp. NPDC059007 TaxID=3346692 RepID=UPI00368F5B6C
MGRWIRFVLGYTLKNVEVRTLPAALKAIMEQRRWTQAQLAEALGVSQTWVSHVSRGMRDTTMGKAIELLSRVGWQVRISPEVEEPVERREFLTAAGRRGPLML